MLRVTVGQPQRDRASQGMGNDEGPMDLECVEDGGDPIGLRNE